MIIIKLQGGLGNQMFQYAAAKSLSKKKYVYLDLSFLDSNQVSSETFTARIFELKIFKNLAIKPATNFHLKLFKSERFGLPRFRDFFKIAILEDQNYQKESEFNHIYLDGYFQNPSNFANIRTELLNDFRFRSLPKDLSKYEDDINQSKKPVSIHVRRGDYLKPTVNSVHGVLSIEYYKKAIELIESKLEKPHYFIFSDDTSWCATNLDFIKNKTIVSDNHLAWVDMYLMSICKHHIIANSSFSWWGAWLNQCTDKIIIAPENWFRNAETKIIPKEWICL